jgi:hypothetical protein
MKRVKIKANEQIYNKWKEIVERINKIARLVDSSCTTLFAKDLEVDLEKLIYWRDNIVPALLEEFDKRRGDVEKLAEISRAYIKATQ